MIACGKAHTVALAGELLSCYILSMVFLYTNSPSFAVQKTVMCTLGGMDCVASWDITNAGCFLRSYPLFKVSTFVQSIAASRIPFVLQVSLQSLRIYTH